MRCFLFDYIYVGCYGLSGSLTMKGQNMSTASILEGTLTALVTPFSEDGEIDYDGLHSLISFQASQNISGIVPAGTTGESATLTEEEHNRLVFYTLTCIPEKIFVMPGCGSNCTKEAMQFVKNAVRHGAEAVLLVDPYYNGPSSLEIRHEYYEPIAKAFPQITIVPYIIPGRTGCALSAYDLSKLHEEFPNICAVKEATGSLDNWKLIRSLCGSEFQIFSGDDDKTLDMMTDPSIEASGVISVISNIAPGALQEMCYAILHNNHERARTIGSRLSALFKIVTVSVENRGQQVFVDKFRNPLPIKTAMNGLGMPAGPCRQPLGKMSVEGVEMIREALVWTWNQCPSILQPIQEHFGVNISERLNDSQIWRKLSY
jgi:4-hydroxy-tetrahydrodipicolinate synthase